MAGAATATLLRRECPDLRVLVIERAPQFTRRVGEATVEISGYFLGRVLGLTKHLNNEHLVKQGMRFWFANEQTHTLADYASSPILVVVFTCNHCPIAQMYERRIQQLELDYRDKGVAVVAIQPNDPTAIRIDELDSSDISDGLEEMKIRAEYKHLQYPYLYDGETQTVTRAYGPQATPHVFVFDQARHLRYEGRVDNSYRTELVKTHDARNAME